MSEPISNEAILKACAGMNGMSTAELAAALTVQGNTMRTRVSRLVKQGRLHMVQRFSGGSPRYYSDLTFALAARHLHKLVASGGHPGTAPSAPEVVIPTTVRPQVISRAGTSTRIDIMFGQAPRDINVALRAGALDFKAIPSLSPFTRGAVR